MKDAYYKNNIKLNLIYIFMIFSILNVIGIVINIPISIPMQVITISLISMIVKFFLFNPLILYIIMALVLTISVIIHRNVYPFLFSFADRVLLLIDNIVQNLKGLKPIADNNILIYWSLLAILFSIYTSIILFKGKKRYLLLPLYLSIFIYYWYSFIDRAYIMLSLFLISYYILMGLSRFSVENKDIRKIYPALESMVVKYSILIILLSMVIPKSNYTLQWPWLYQKVYNQFPFIENLRSNSSYSRNSNSASLFDFSITGYQNNSQVLGGPVSLSDKKIMTVESKEKVYLRGNVKKYYTGNNWISTIDDNLEYKTGENFGGISSNDSEDYYEENIITITNQSFASTTLFSPYLPVKVELDKDSGIKTNLDNVLIYPQGIYSKESYTITVMEPLPYGVLKSKKIVRNTDDIEDLNTYLQYPEDKITTRTKELVKKIVQNKKNDFEKAIAIESYLRENYEYNLLAESLPPDREFIDYFLFEGKNGYCTYYATSLAIMLRLEGIPTRYVEGYLAQDSEKIGIFEVSQKNAHAWVEAFIEPVGWMTFEATPVYSVLERAENYSSVTDEDIAPDVEVDFDQSDNPRYPRGWDIILDDEQYGGDYNYNLDDENIPSGTTIPKYVLDLIIISLVSIIPMRFLVGFILFKIQESSYKKLSINNRIIYLYHQIVILNKLQDFPQEIGETHFEYANRIAYKFFKYHEKGIKEITDIFVKSKYSSIPATLEELEEMENYREKLESRLKHYLGRRKYYYKKYISERYWQLLNNNFLNILTCHKS